MAKYNFAKNIVKYQGCVIENNFTPPIFNNAKPIRGSPVLSTQKQVRQSLGKVNFP